MKVEQIVGLVLLRISGGKASPDLSVQPWDIKEYIPDEINAINSARIHEELGVDPNYPVNGLFVNILENLPLSTNSRNLSFITFPQRPLTIVGARSVVAVGVQGGKTFTRVPHDSGTLGAFYWKTKTDVTTYDVEGETVVFYNLPATSTDIWAKIVVHIDSLSMTDDIFVPSGMEGVLIDKLYAKAIQQRSGVRDTISNGEDVK